MPRLRKLLARVVFMGVAATQNGCCCGDYEDPEVDVDLDRSSPAISALIDRCDANPDDCEALCRAALETELGADAAFYEIIECDVTTLAPDGANVRVTYYDNVACGRAPEALHACDLRDGGDPVVRWLARAAYLEAASVVAFVHLAADLVRHRAPRALVAAAIAAAHDEVRHAAAMRALIRGRVAVPVPRIGTYRAASLRELALLNAVEGCARETIGAAIALWQARAAPDPELRVVFEDIARDEIAHAELAWAIHAWVIRRLEPGDATAVVLAREAALHCLRDELVTDPAAAALGLPTRDETRALVDAVRPALDVATRSFALSSAG